MRRRTVGAWSAVVGAVFVLAPRLVLAATSAAAADPVAEHANAPSVEIAVVGDFAGANAVGARVASWFEGQSMQARTTRVSKLSPEVVFAPGDTAGVRLWVVLASPTAARLFFAVQEQPGSQPRFLVQDVELAGGVDELGRISLGMFY
jgi:hypothetical protein